MSLANDTAFPADADVLLRYGVLRQHAEQHGGTWDVVGDVSCCVLPPVCKPGVLAHVREAMAGLGTVSIVAAQRQSAWVNQLAWELTSGTFLRGLEANTGLQNVLPDPAFCQGGWLQPVNNAPLAKQHPIWHLPAAVVLDICVKANGHDCAVVFPQGAVRDVAVENALAWQLTDPALQPVWPAQACVLRVVYYQGAGELA